MTHGHPASDEGSASLEFITAGLVLLIPTVYLILTMSVLQSASLASEGAAREGARVFVLANDRGSAQRDSSAAIELTLADYGIHRDQTEVRVSCEPDADECLARGSRVTVTVTVNAALPLAPAVIGTDSRLSIPISSTATHTVSRFRGDE